MLRIAGNATGDIPVGLGPGDELAAAPPQAIGKIREVIGSVTITRARGIVVQVRTGVLVYQGDVIETAADGAVAIIFRDGTAFILSTSARMVLNEFICAPNANSNSARFSVAQGIFAFIAGNVAKSGSLSIDTPAARIRGAAQGGGTGILTLGALTFALVDQLQAHSQFAILDDGVITYKDLPHGVFEIVTRGGELILADDPGETIRIDAAGNVTRVSLAASRVAELQQAAHAVSLLSQDPGAAPGSGSGPSDGGGSPDFLTPLPINYETPPAIDSPGITPLKDPFILVLPPPPAPAPVFPDVVVTGTATEGSPVPSSGTLAGLGAVQAAGPDGLLGTFDDVLISPATFSLSSDTSGLPLLMAHGEMVSYSVVGNVLTASAGGQMLFTLTVGADASWSFDLLHQLDHVNDGTNSANTALRLAGGGSMSAIDFSSIILADGTPLGNGSFSLTVIDATPTVSGNNVFQLDEDALGGGEAGASGDNPDAANTSGTLAFSFGADAPGSIAFLTSGAPSGFTYELSGNDLLVKQGATVVLTVTLNTTTGAYTVTQNNPILHALGAGENNQTFAIGYQVTDADGDTTTGAFSIDVHDDVPTATAEASQDVAEGTTVTGTFDFVAGADRATVTHINGTALVFGDDGYSQAIDIGDGSIRVKADGSYKFTADDPVIGTGAASATFTVTDGDGDAATADVSFVVTDANVPIGGKTAAAVDDDGLSGGNPASVTGDLATPDSDGDHNEATFGGTLAFSFGGDGAGSVDFASMDGTTAKVGQETVHYSWNAASNTLTAAGPRGVLFTVVVTAPATGAYTLTLVDTVLQAWGPNAENDATAALIYTITDADGSSTTGTLNITFDDDAPTATAEASQKVAEGATITGMFDFVAGADGATVTHINGKALVFGYDGYSQAIDIGDGSIRVKADGSYKFNADNPVIGTGAATATFTVTDRDGDTATANASFVIADTNVPTGGKTAAAVDDDGLSKGNAASVTGDLAVPNSDGDYNEATFGGTLEFSFGGDGAGSVDFASMDGTSGTVGQETVHYCWDAYSNTVTATGPRGLLFTVVVTNPATGTYTVKLVDNVLQTRGPNGENDATAALTYTITDADGSSTIGTLNITFDDDAPTATAEAKQSVAEGGSVSGTFGFVAGADGAMVTHINGKTLVFGYDGYSQAIDIGDGSIRVKANGSYKFTADDPVIGTGAASATFTVTDRDGDTATANASFGIMDANVPTGGTTAAAVDDDGLAGGNAASKTGDLAVPNSDGDCNEATFGGALAFSFGGDGAGTVGFAAMDGTSGTVGQETFHYSWNAATNTLTATGPRGVLFTVVVTNPATGAYTVTLVDNVLQAECPDGENDATAALTYTITDADGSSTTGKLNITFDDDAPTICDIQDAVLPNVNGAVVNGTWNPAFGGDGPAICNAITLTLGCDPAGFDYQQTALDCGTSQEGTTVFKVDVFETCGTTPEYTFYYFSFYDEAAHAAVLKAYTQAPALDAGTYEFPVDSEYFILTMDSDGTYAFELINNDFSVTQTADASDADPGNYGPKMYIVGNEFFDKLPEGAIADIIVDGFDGKNIDQNVFVNQNGIGVGNGNLDANEYVTMQFTQDQTEVIFTIGKLQMDRSVTFLVSAEGKPAIEYTVLGTSATLTVNASDFGLTDFDSLKITKIVDKTPPAGFGDDDQVNIGSITFNSQTVVSDATYNFQVSVKDGDGDVFVSPDELTVKLEGDDGYASSVATADFNLSALFPDTENTQTIVQTDVNGDSVADMAIVMDGLHHTLNSTNFIVS